MRAMYWKSIWLFVLAVLAVTIAAPSAEAAEPVPKNQIVVMVDGSGSFGSRRMKALEQTRRLLEKLKEHRRDDWQEPREYIAVISIDALPEVLWAGTPKQLQNVEPGQWKTRFEARSDYAGCTDVQRAFEEAVKHLDGESSTTSKYLFVFSDLVHEPPADRMNRCEDADFPSTPAEAFPYDALNGVSVSMFWLPRDQKLVWSRAFDEHRVGDRTALG